MRSDALKAADRREAAQTLKNLLSAPPVLKQIDANSQTALMTSDRAARRASAAGARRRAARARRKPRARANLRAQRATRAHTELTWTYIVRSALASVEHELMTTFQPGKEESLSAAKKEHVHRLCEFLRWVCKQADDREPAARRCGCVASRVPFCIVRACVGGRTKAFVCRTTTTTTTTRARAPQADRGCTTS